MLFSHACRRAAAVTPRAWLAAARRAQKAAARPLSSEPRPSTKPRVVVLGSGWGGNKVARALDKDKFDVHVVSPANHFLFTPLLPSTAVGTLEFRAVQEPVRTIPGLGRYLQAKARTLDVERRVVTCESIFKKETFDVPYDFLVVSAGSKTNTFNVPGVKEKDQPSVMFLKHLYHARRIRDRILECFERAASPLIETEAERRDLVRFVVVGGGATACEFATELSDFMEKDVRKWFPDIADLASLVLVEAGPKILAGFDDACVTHYTKFLRQHGVDVRTGVAVTAVDGDDKGGASTATLSLNDETLKFGCMVWSAGLAPVKFVAGTDALETGPHGRVLVDKYLRAADRVFAIGDCAADRTSPLAPTASAAEQQATYLARVFNESGYAALGPRDDVPEPVPVLPSAFPFDFLAVLDALWDKKRHFQYIERGKMASMGAGGGVADLTHSEIGPHVTMEGIAAFASWRGAYLSKQVSVKNMILIPMFWFKSWLFGRDISRF